MRLQIAILSYACFLVYASSLAADATQIGKDAAAASGITNSVSTLPLGEQVIRRVLERSAAVAAMTNAPAWAYDKRTVMEKLDGDGKVEDRTEKLYRVRIVQGVPFSRLVKVEGRELSESELKKENQREAAFQKQLSGRDPKKAVDKHEALITKELVDRYQYQALRREAIQGRQTVVVSFKAKSNKDDGSIENRVLNRLAGTLWVDELTADVARLEVHLTEGFSMGVFGVLGAIKDCRMDMTSRLMTDGTWLPEKTKMSLSARMLFSGVRFQMEETSANFTLESVPSTALP